MAEGGDAETAPPSELVKASELDSGSEEAVAEDEAEADITVASALPFTPLPLPLLLLLPANAPQFKALPRAVPVRYRFQLRSAGGSREVRSRKRPQQRWCV